MAYCATFSDILRHGSLGKVIYITTISRSLSLWVSNCNKYGSREARFMKKIMGTKSTGKKEWYNFQDAGPKSPFPKTIASTGGQKQRRIAVLNKVFMRHISEMMGSGEISSIIVGRGLEISKVKMAPDFNRINVFWLARESENDAEIAEILDTYSWKLRHELSQLRVIGEVPPIYFIKDKEYSKTVEVNRILATADYGEDYIPVDVGYRFKSEFSQSSQLPLPMNQVKQLEGEELEEISEPLLPPMRNDVLGLKHADIMAKIKGGMKKAKALHRQDTVASNSEAEPEFDKPAEQILDANINPKKEEFTRFLIQQKIQRKKKMSHVKKNYSPEMEMYESEVLENSHIAAEFMDNIDEDRDYVDYVEDRRI